MKNTGKQKLMERDWSVYKEVNLDFIISALNQITKFVEIKKKNKKRRKKEQFPATARCMLQQIEENKLIVHYG